MSRVRRDRNALAQALEHAMREATAQSVLFSQLVARRLGITSTDLECLDIIHLRGPVTAGDLAQATGLTTGAVTGIIDRLEQAGFARRERDTTDRRKVFVRSLPAIERRIAPLFVPMQRAFEATLAGYGEAELALFVDFLTRAHHAAVVATASLRNTPTPSAPKRRPQGARPQVATPRSRS
jgi:DNA-binding MarR family transcriptional regulator